MKFEIKPRQTENGIVTDIFMDGRYISDSVTAFKIAASNDEMLHITLTFIGEIDFCADDFEKVSQKECGMTQQYLYMPRKKQPPQKDRKGLWQRLRQRG